MQRPRINEAIRAKKLRVIGEDNTPLGVLSKQDALIRARSVDLDLVIVAEKADPPIAKIVDWGKYSYEKKKKQQKIKRDNALKRKNELKSMKFGIKIGDSDLKIKIRKIQEFLEENNKVKIMIVLRGREIEHKNLAFALAQKIIDSLEGAVVDQNPKLGGHRLNFTVRGGKNA